ncbi:hypothetical protein A946_09890 [Methylacidiphilum kamchatkense Kam1]|uniref:Lipoprotein n=1 Tax=Methylacidiphilum kamchatkense Kam1 TaxID=1202785 RepID=A0A0C1UMY5_9BACT|nr:hypothetical protein [Methylacidiphilum kamchatkense]KIE57954.1 hypothetical protein A946_09890 [Methylacidiphilum kamchatkense Kam1]QDQ42385.1 hypothetical protein kam1_1157 [Methylacidiphilum kamchatkense Kam1]
MGKITINRLSLFFFFNLFYTGCSIQSSYLPSFPQNIECQKIDYLLSASQLRVVPSKEGFTLSTPLVYANRMLLPIGTEVRAKRVFPQTLPPRYIVEAIRLNSKSSFVPATGVVFYSEGKYWLTLSNLYLPKN